MIKYNEIKCIFYTCILIIYIGKHNKINSLIEKYSCMPTKKNTVNGNSLKSTK